MKKLFISAISILLISLNAYSQSSVSEVAFQPNGKPLVAIYSDFREDIQNGKSNPAFELTRSQLGYAYNFSPVLSGKVVFDVASTPGLKPSSFTAYVYNAFVEYNNKLVTMNFGVIPTSTFKLQESTWGKRYLLKSYQDLYGFSASGDLGATAKLQLLPQLSVDAQILNGEGYKSVQSDSAIKVAVGLTLQPIKNVNVRVYGDYMKKDAAQKTFNAFLSYTGKSLTIGGEYNYQEGNKMVSGHNLSGVSFFGTYKTSKKVSVFARYDNLTSNTLSGASNPWNKSNDGQLYVAGMEYFPVKGVTIAPNIRYTDPKLASLKPTTSLMMNVYLYF